MFARDYFARVGAKKILIPGIGHGRNARPFLECLMSVTGIEISETAIGLAWRVMGLDTHDSPRPVTDTERKRLATRRRLINLRRAARTRGPRRSTECRTVINVVCRTGEKAGYGVEDAPSALFAASRAARNSSSLAWTLVRLSGPMRIIIFWAGARASNCGSANAKDAFWRTRSNRRGETGVARR